jgi:protein ImuB
MSYVCLWSPSWPTGADFPADLVAALLVHAPRITVGEAGRVWGDARGLNAGRLAQQMLSVASDHGFGDAHAGAAMTPIAAEVAATRSTSSFIVVKPGNDRSFIAPCPIAVLDPPEQLATLLEGLGIESCAALAALDAESVEVRLGADGVRLWERARADDDRWLFRAPLRALPSASLEWVEYGLKDPERLLFVINSLAGTVCTALVARGERAREIALVFSLGNRTQRTYVVRSSRPSSEQRRWMRLVREELDKLTLPDAVSGVALRAESVTGNDGAQGDLFDRGFASAPMVEEALTQLADDQGDVVVRPMNSAHPLVEERTRWVEERGAANEGARQSPLAPHPSLTLQLLPTPKIVTVTTASRRDHEIPVSYRDGAEWHALLDVAGPDRVAGGEWSSAYARDYFRCVREDGTMVWLFTGASHSSDWFLHGWWD